jgi:DNA-binding CsgD family transcriptional regulator
MLDHVCITGSDISAAERLYVAPIPPRELLEQLFGLTAAETRVVERLGMGASPEPAAAFLQVRTSTARWHLASIYRKSGTNRRAELVRLLQSIATM